MNNDLASVEDDHPRFVRGGVAEVIVYPFPKATRLSQDPRVTVPDAGVVEVNFCRRRRMRVIHMPSTKDAVEHDTVMFCSTNAVWSALASELASSDAEHMVVESLKEQEDSGENELIFAARDLEPSGGNGEVLDLLLAHINTRNMNDVVELLRSEIDGSTLESSKC